MNKQFFIRYTYVFVAAVISFSFFGCATTDNQESGASYESVVKTFTERQEFYNGFANVFQAQATMLNSQVIQAQLDKKNKAFAWDSTRFNEEKRKADESLRSETVYFLSFFSPEKKINDLDRATSLWKVYLEVNGRKYEAKVVKYLGSVEELSLYFPYHNKFAMAYKLQFPISSYEVEKQVSKVILTGPIGAEVLTFRAL